MTDQKAYFQSISNTMEDLLRQYKQSYPLDFGSLLRNMLPIALIILPIFMCFTDFVHDAVVCIMPTMIFIFGVVIFIKQKGHDNLKEYILEIILICFGVFVIVVTFDVRKIPLTNILVALMLSIVFILSTIILILNRNDSKQIKNILQNIAQQKELLKPYRSYPDVNDYLTRYDNILNETTSEKEQITKRYRIMIISIIAISIGIFAIIQIANQRNQDSDCNENPSSELEDIIDIPEQEPFLTLSPLDEHIEEDDTTNVHHNKIEVYCDNNYFAANLMILQINTENTDTTGIYYLIITNQDGSMIPDCPKFILHGNNLSNIPSESICRDRNYYSHTKLEVITLMLYLKNHKNSLRYKIEKVE